MNIAAGELAGDRLRRQDRDREPGDDRGGRKAAAKAR